MSSRCVSSYSFSGFSEIESSARERPAKRWGRVAWRDEGRKYVEDDDDVDSKDAVEDKDNEDEDDDEDEDEEEAEKDEDDDEAGCVV